MTSSTRLPLFGVVSTTYLSRTAALAALDTTVGKLIPGASGGRLVSAVTAEAKSAVLQIIASNNYNPVNLYQSFSGQDISCVRDAIVYASQKKGTKSSRQYTVASAENTAGIIGATIGGTAGSVAMPVAGTVGGAAVGGAVGKASVGIGYHFFRKSKWLYKTIRGTRGVHRNEAAACLYSAACDAQGRDKLAATAALLVLLGAEYDHFMAKPDLAVARISSRMKSV